MTEIRRHADRDARRCPNCGGRLVELDAGEYVEGVLADACPHCRTVLLGRDADELPPPAVAVEATPSRRRPVVAEIPRSGASAAAPFRARLMAVPTMRRRAVRRRALAVAVAALAGAALVAASVAVLPGDTPRPTIERLAALATRPAAEPAPDREPGTVSLLALAVDGVHYPDWRRSYGWRPVGARVDRIGGRRAATVFYARGGRRIGYTIVAGPALPAPAGSLRTVREGTELRTFTASGRPVVTWRRKGRTCILSGERVTAGLLSELAAWEGAGSVRF